MKSKNKVLGKVSYCPKKFVCQTWLQHYRPALRTELQHHRPALRTELQKLNSGYQSLTVKTLKWLNANRKVMLVTVTGKKMLE